MKKLSLVWAGIFLMLSAVAFAGEIAVGSITPLTGKLAVYGQGFQKAIMLAEDEVNAAGGIKGSPLKVLFEDNQSSAQGSVSAIRKLITVNKVPVIFGPAASSNFLAVCPIAQENKTVLIGAESAAAEITKCGDYVFRVFPSDKLQGRGVAELTTSLGYNAVVLTYVDNDWGVGLAEVFKADYKGKILDEIPHQEGKTDYRSELLRIRQSHPKAVVNLTYIKEGATMLKQAYEMGFSTQWLMGSASKSPKLVELAGKAAEGIIGTYPSFSQDTPAARHFKAAWDKKYPGVKVPIFAEYNYDMMHLTAKALAAAKTLDADAIRQALMTVSRGYEGVTGDKTFDKNGDVGAAYGRWTVKEGKIVDYK